MRICLVSHFEDNPAKGDIGTKNVAVYLSKELSKNHEVMKTSVRNVKSWRYVRAFKPQIIHFVLGPSTLGFVIAKTFSLYYHNAKIIMSAPNPSYLPLKGVIPLFKPNLILVQSWESEKMFVDLGLRTRFLPNGVDVERFVPISEDFKKRLRRKYGIDEGRFVVLHVGPIIKGRTIQLLKELQNKETQVIVIGRRAPMEKDLYRLLEKAGCLIWTNRFEHIEDVYALSDCYVFPTSPKNKTKSIELPLSVLEAMSCNLPVITTKFGALPRIFEKDRDGLFFVENEEDIYKFMEILKNGDTEVRTREMILPYSWKNVIGRLEKIYKEA